MGAHEDGPESIEIGGHTFRFRKPPRVVVDVGEPMRLEFDAHHEPPPEADPGPGAAWVDAIVSTVYIVPETAAVRVRFVLEDGGPEVVELEFPAGSELSTAYRPGQRERLRITIGTA